MAVEHWAQTSWNDPPPPSPAVRGNGVRTNRCSMAAEGCVGLIGTMHERAAWRGGWHGDFPEVSMAVEHWAQTSWNDPPPPSPAVRGNGVRTNRCSMAAEGCVGLIGTMQ